MRWLLQRFRGRIIGQMLCLLVGMGISTMPAQMQSDPTIGHVRLGHFAIDAGGLDIYVDNTLTLENTVSGIMADWREIEPGDHTIVIVTTGGDPTIPLLVPRTVTVQAGDWLTLALIGRRSDGTLRLHTLLEDFSPIQAGETRLSIFNAFNNNPPLDVTADDIPIVKLLAYPNTLEEGNDGLETVNLLAGTYDVSFFLVDGQRVTDITDIGLGRNRHYFIAILGTMDNPRTVIVTSDMGVLLGDITATPEPDTTITPIRVTLTPAATRAAATASPTTEATAEVTAEPILIGDDQVLLRVGNFAPGVEEIIIFVDNEAFIASLAYPSLSEYVLLDAGTYDIAVVLAGETLAQAVLRQSVLLVPNSVNTLMVIGALSNGTFALQPVVEDYTLMRAGLARVAIFNAVPDAQFINLIANNNNVLVQGLAFPGVFEGAGDGFITFDVLAGTYALEVLANDLPLLNLGDIRMGSGRYYFIVIAGTTNSAFFLLESNALTDIQTQGSTP